MILFFSWRLRSVNMFDFCLFFGFVLTLSGAALISPCLINSRSPPGSCDFYVNRPHHMTHVRCYFFHREAATTTAAVKADGAPARKLVVLVSRPGGNIQERYPSRSQEEPKEPGEFPCGLGENLKRSLRGARRSQEEPEEP